MELVTLRYIYQNLELVPFRYINYGMELVPLPFFPEEFSIHFVPVTRHPFHIFANHLTHGKCNTRKKPTSWVYTQILIPKSISTSKIEPFRSTTRLLKSKLASAFSPWVFFCRPISPPCVIYIQAFACSPYTDVAGLEAYALHAFLPCQPATNIINKIHDP